MRTAGERSAKKTKRPILIVDDEGDECRRLSGYVELRGWPTRVATTVKEGLGAIRSGERFAAMICDGHVGQRSGIVVIRAAREAQPDLPILALTAFWDDHDFVNEAQALGAEYAHKPTDVGPFIRRVAIRHHLHDEGLICRVDQAANEHGLSLRAMEVLALIVADCSYETVAEELDIKLDTVREHVRAIKRNSKKSAGELAVLIRSSLKKDRETE